MNVPIAKAYRILRTRPLRFFANLRSYALFSSTRLLQPLFHTRSAGIRLGLNVRTQRLRCLIAELPLARIEIGDDAIIYENARVEAYGAGKISIGPGAILGDTRVYARSEVQIGARTMTSWNVLIQDFDPHPIDPELRGLQARRMAENFRPSFRQTRPLPDFSWTFPASPIVIGEDVWVGANVTILKGARIGNGSVIAAGSVVPAGDWPARSILAGVPARVIKTIPSGSNA